MSQEMTERNSHLEVQGLTGEQISEIRQNFIMAFGCTFKWDLAEVLGTLKISK